MSTSLPRLSPVITQLFIPFSVRSFPPPPPPLQTVTYDFHRMMGSEAKLLKCSEFGKAVVSHF